MSVPFSYIPEKNFIVIEPVDAVESKGKTPFFAAPFKGLFYNTLKTLISLWLPKNAATPAPATPCATPSPALRTAPAAVLTLSLVEMGTAQSYSGDCSSLAGLALLGPPATALFGHRLVIML